VSCPAPLQPWT